MTHGWEITARSPLRISFAGGGTDVEPFPSLYGGLVVNATIDSCQKVRLKTRIDRRILLRLDAQPTREYAARGEIPSPANFIHPLMQALGLELDGFELHLQSAVPYRSGLGGSGAMCLAVAGAFNCLRDEPLAADELAELAYRVEHEVLGNACGRQDQYAAAYGGINCFAFHRGQVSVQPVVMDLRQTRLLEQSLLLLWLGQRKNDSGQIIEEQTRSVENGGAALLAMQRSKAHVPAMAEALARADIPALGRLLHRLWEEKKQFSQRISNAHIDAVYEHLQEHGMIGGKITGAGAGGHMLLCCLPEDRSALLDACRELALPLTPFRLEFTGMQTHKKPANYESQGEYLPTSEADTTAAAG